MTLPRIGEAGSIRQIVGKAGSVSRRGKRKATGWVGKARSGRLSREGEDGKVREGKEGKERSVKQRGIGKPGMGR